MEVEGVGELKVVGEGGTGWGLVEAGVGRGKRGFWPTVLADDFSQ